MLSFTIMPYNFSIKFFCARKKNTEKSDLNSNWLRSCGYNTIVVPWVRRRGPDWARGLCTMGRRGKCRPGTFRPRRVHSRPRVARLWSSTGSPHGLTNPNAGCGGRRSPSGARVRREVAGRRALGGCGSRPRGQACDGAGRLRTGRHRARQPAGDGGRLRGAPTDRAGR